MQIKNRQQLLIIGAIAAVALFAGDRLVLSPLLKAWSVRATRIADLRKDINRANTDGAARATTGSKHPEPLGEDVPQRAAEQHLRRRTAGLQGH